MHSTSSEQKEDTAGPLVPMTNHLQSQLEVYKKQDLAKQVAERLKSSLAVYQEKVGTLAQVKKLKNGLPALAVLKVGSHAYDTTKKGLTLQSRLETLYREYSFNILQLLNLMESLESSITVLEQKFKMMIDDLTLRFDYKYFEQPLQQVMGIVNRLSTDQFENQVKAVFSEVFNLKRELEDLSAELPQSESEDIKQEEKEIKIKIAKDRTLAVFKEKANLEAQISSCNALINSYTDKISSTGDKLNILKEQIEYICSKIKEYQDLKYEGAAGVTGRLNELRELEHEQLKQQQSTLNEDKDRLREKQQKLLEQIEQQIADAITKLQAYQLAGQTHVSFHLLFLLDESGSMSNYFQDVEQAFHDFIKNRIQKNQSDIVSVIKFNSVGTIIYDGVSINSDFSRVKLTGGGTDFVQAFGKVQQILSKGCQEVPVVIFMTDGQDSRIAPVVAQVEQLYRTFSQMMLFSIAFSDSVDMEQIKAITRAGNGGVLERTSQGKKYQMVISCSDQLQLINAFSTVSGACNELDSIKALIATLKEQRQWMIEDNRHATEEYYKLHDDILRQQLQSTKNIQKIVTEDSKDSHLDSLIQEEVQRKQQLEAELNKLQNDEMSLNQDLKNQQNIRNQLQAQLDDPNLASRIAACSAEEKRLIEIFDEGKDRQTQGGYDILSKEQLYQMNHSVVALLEMAENVRFEHSHMKSLIQETKDSLKNTEEILKDINIDLVVLSAMKEQGFYEIMIEFHIFKEEDIYPDGREGKFNPKSVTIEDLQNLYKSLFEKQIDEHPELLEQLLEIFSSKETLLKDLNAKIDTKIYNGQTESTNNTTGTKVLEEEKEEEDTETLLEAMMMIIYELIDSEYADKVRDVKEKENDIKAIERDIRNLKNQRYLEKQMISKEDAKEQIKEKGEELKNSREELKELKNEEKKLGKDLQRPIKSLKKAALMLKELVESKIKHVIEEKPRMLLKYQYYIFQSCIHENVSEFINLLRGIANKTE